MSQSVAIIPARGGSKGVPRKNALPLAGKPLLGWTIDAALQAQSVVRVVVSTDNPEIAQIAESFGADVVWRPANLSGDLASSESAVLHALDTLEADGFELPEVTAFLQCTAPLMQWSDIDGTFDALIKEKADTALAVADFHYFVWENDEHGDFVGVNHDKRVRKMRQERTPQFIETGSVYLMRTAGFRSQRHRFFGKTAHYVMPPERVLEIDDPVDFKVAQMLLEERLKSERQKALPQKIGLLVFDFDGVFTDDSVIVSQDGTESVVCNRGDGMGISLLREAGVPMMILSTEVNEVVRRRAEKLKLPVVHGVGNKLEVLNEILEERNVPWTEVVYLGNDVNDVHCLLQAGCGVAVADASKEAIAASRIVLSRSGGRKAVRELADLILSQPSLQRRSK